MTWWTLNHLSNIRSWNNLYTLASTTQPDHLFMAWSHYKPRRHAIYRVLRGKQVFCGWEYIWDSPVINEQTEPGDTNWHTFHIHHLESDHHVWYYLFAPDGPYGFEIQGPLVHIPPPEVHLWTTRMYVGTQLKGLFYTDTFTGPGGADPVWRTRNTGLHSLQIYQLEPDRGFPAYRFFAVVGPPGSRKVYIRVPPVAEEWVPILTNAEALTITGSASGVLWWVATNPWFAGHLYVLFNSALTNNGTWCIRSQDYGATWEAFQIYSGIQNYRAGNIMAGMSQGSSPYAPGTILYAALNTQVGARTGIYLSNDQGVSWALRDFKGMGALTPRCLVDPQDQGTVYIGAFTNPANPHELWRSQQHGANLAEVDAADHLGIMIIPFHPDMWINPTDRNTATVLEGDHLFTTADFCATWADHGVIQRPAARLALLWEQPQRLYLAKHTSGSFPPFTANTHVIFVTDNWGLTMQGKAGPWPGLPDGGDVSIPYNCGGVCLQGMMPFPPY